MEVADMVYEDMRVDVFERDGDGRVGDGHDAGV